MMQNYSEDSSEVQTSKSSSRDMQHFLESKPVLFVTNSIITECSSGVSAANHDATLIHDLKDLALKDEQLLWLQNNCVSITNTRSIYEWNSNILVTVVAMIKGHEDCGSEFQNKASVNDGKIGLILDQTPFYFESNGQLFDTGILHGDGCDFIVESVKSYAGYVVHVGYIQGTGISTGTKLEAHVDYDRRSLIASNHTIQHVLNFILRETLPADIEDSRISLKYLSSDHDGILIDDEKLTVDISVNDVLTVEQIKELEMGVRNVIKSSITVFTDDLSSVAAKNVFGLKCATEEDTPVRVVCFGCSAQMILEDSERETTDMWISLCGGMHLTNTSEAEDFVIVEQKKIGDGIVRIVGLTKWAARDQAAKLTERLSVIEDMVPGEEFRDCLARLVEEVCLFSVCSQNLMTSFTHCSCIR
jgi:alanyl-tRNA synthetase